jgi:XRE family transcriptional regulator, aerobic/anaerobic benzoate catabolism transcriptional regulator
VVSDAATFNLLAVRCTTVWLRPALEDHINRVMAPGDIRPAEAREEAMADLRTVLAGREAFDAKADLCIDTSARR